MRLKEKNISIDLQGLENLLGVPVVGTSARNGEGLEELKSTIKKRSPLEKLKLILEK